MALWVFSNLTKYGVVRSKLISMSEENLQKIKLDNFGPHTLVRFKYTHIHSYEPRLYNTPEGKFILPTWVKVHPDTTLDDIDWKVEAKPMVKEDPNVWKFQSSSSKDVFYTVRKIGYTFKCDCPGFFRSKGKCKHVQNVSKGLAS